MPAMQHRALVGAIRWDAWHGELSEVGRAVEKTLSPPQYRFRLPWFAQVSKDGNVRIRGDLPGVLEQEIVYARMAGLDCWAFVTYGVKQAVARQLSGPRRETACLCPNCKHRRNRQYGT